ncbi:trimethyllysine dioxygenase, mitochondrial [Cydia fagiglandana]|uniref:trimethyllysine dioxygenase, mitochondrial n=1 Tax=Cydia fagiglandana TaxID=1458189 RepID=UPI002FEE2C49
MAAVTRIQNITKIKGTVDVNFANGTTVKFEDCWLRDHCRCATCYHADTYQRAQHILDIPEAKIADVAFAETQLVVTWNDNHRSTYEADFLVQFNYETYKEGQRLKPVLWHGGSVAEKIARVQADKFLKTKEAAEEVFQSLLDYGVALIEGVDPNLEATEQVCKALGGVQHTIFGGMWEFTTKADHADTAYTNLPLAVHNDSTYFTESTGLQILHCIEHSGGVGGETVLVDGFYGATRLQAEFPEDFDFLTEFELEAEYIEEGHHHKCAAPVIRIDKRTKDIKQIRFNVYDRAPMAFEDGEECRAYYRALRRLAKYYQDAGNQWQFKLKPGVVMVMDNFRVLHGRTGFSGKRVLCGSYVARSDWLDRARALRLIQ